jgi:hypothetical protein
MHLEAGFREGATNKNFLRRSLNACPISELIAERAPYPYVQLN